jgi:hypothetical protein
MNMLEYNPNTEVPAYYYLYVGSKTGELYLLRDGYVGAGELRLGWRAADDSVEAIELIDQWVEVVKLPIKPRDTYASALAVLAVTLMVGFILSLAVRFSLNS